MLKQIKNTLKELGFNSNETSVYISLTQLGEATASQVAKKADLPRTTVISLLARLCQDGYLTEHRHRGKTYYWIESPKTIGAVLEQKVAMARELNELLNGLYRSAGRFPSVRVCDTKSGIKRFIENFLANLEKKSLLCTIDSPLAKNYAKIYFEEMEKAVMAQKNKRGIITRSLIPYGSFKNIEEYKIKNQVIEIRELPETIELEASLWITKDTLVHFSGNPIFLISLKHEAVVKSIKSVYDFLWNISAPKNKWIKQ